MKRIIILAVLVPLLASCLSVGGRRVDTVPTIGIIVSEYMNFEREMAVAAAERLAYDHGGTFITRDWTLDKGDAFTIEIIEFPDAEEGLFLETVGNFSVIVTLNYSYSILLERHHMDFPETHFIGIHSWFPDLSDDANVTIVHGNFIEGGFCAGVAAALSGANTVGYIGAEEEGPRGEAFWRGPSTRTGSSSSRSTTAWRSWEAGMITREVMQWPRRCTKTAWISYSPTREDPMKESIAQRWKTTKWSLD